MMSDQLDATDDGANDQNPKPAHPVWLLVIFVLVCLSSVAITAVNWGTRLLDDGPAQVGVGAAGAIGSIAAAGVALWFSQRSLIDAANARAETRKVQREAADREAKIRQDYDRLEELRRHENIRPVIAVNITWNTTTDKNGVVATPVTTSVYSFGHSVAFAVSQRFENRLVPRGAGGSLSDQEINPWPDMKPPESSVILPIISANQSSDEHILKETSDLSPLIGAEGRVLYFIRYRDSLSGWWMSSAVLALGDRDIPKDKPTWVDLTAPVMIPPPPWEPTSESVKAARITFGPPGVIYSSRR
jgi:hypothetical protein